LLALVANTRAWFLLGHNLKLEWRWDKCINVLRDYVEK
jgi:hypothetical protein